MPSMVDSCERDEPNTLVIIQPEIQGHHFALHIETILANVRDAYRIIVLTSVRYREHRIIKEFQEKWRGRVTVQFFESAVFPANPTPLRILRYQFQQYRAFRRAHRDLGLSSGSHVYLALLGCPIPFSLFGSAFGDSTYSTLYMHSPHARPVGSGWRAKAGVFFKGWTMEQILKDPRLQHMFYINELTRPILEDLPQHLQDKAVFVGDCYHDMAGFARSQARKELGIDDTRFVVLAVGELTPRKGLSRLLGAAASVWNRGHVPLCLLIGGSANGLPSPDRVAIRQHAQIPALCRFYEGFQPTSRLKLMFAASDAVWLGYEGFKEMSGVLMQSIALEIPIIGTTDGLIGFLTNKYRLGPAIPPNGTASAVDAIESLYSDPSGYAEYVRGCAEMKRAYSAVPFGATIAALLTRAVTGACQPQHN
jgi:glycosyltransferase involved in cell wall biosynthesis